MNLAVCAADSQANGRIAETERPPVFHSMEEVSANPTEIAPIRRNKGFPKAGEQRTLEHRCYGSRGIAVVGDSIFLILNSTRAICQR